MIKVDNLSVYFKSEKLLDRVSFTLNPNSKTLLLGPNGSGKTTLIKILAGIFSFKTGSVLIKDKRPQEIKQKIGLQLQDSMLYSELTVFENLDFYSKLYGSNYLASCFQWIEYLKNKKVKILSLGEKAKVSITRAIINNPDYLFLDEPTAFLDDKSLEQFVKLIYDWSVAKNGGGVSKILFVATHSPEHFRKLNPSLLRIQDNKVISTL